MTGLVSSWNPCVPARGPATRLYELPGTRFWLDLRNLQLNMTVTVTLMGRAN